MEPALHYEPWLQVVVEVWPVEQLFSSSSVQLSVWVTTVGCRPCPSQLFYSNQRPLKIPVRFYSLCSSGRIRTGVKYNFLFKIKHLFTSKVKVRLEPCTFPRKDWRLGLARQAWYLHSDVSDKTMANSTVMFSGINPEGRNSSKVLRPPGGGSSLGPFSADCEEVATTKAAPAKAEVVVPAEKDEVTVINLGVFLLFI